MTHSESYQPNITYLTKIKGYFENEDTGWGHLKQMLKLNITNNWAN